MTTMVGWEQWSASVESSTLSGSTVWISAWPLPISPEAPSSLRHARCWCCVNQQRKRRVGYFRSQNMALVDTRTLLRSSNIVNICWHALIFAIYSFWLKSLCLQFTMMDNLYPGKGISGSWISIDVPVETLLDHRNIPKHWNTLTIQSG